MKSLSRIYSICPAGLLILALFSGLSPALGNSVYHVAVDGREGGVGSLEDPMQSIQAALDRAQPGDTVRLGPGVFYQQLALRRSGTENAPITLEGSLGPNGERLSRIAAGRMVDPETWEPAPEVGPHVYRNTSFDFHPGLLTVDGLYVGFVHPSNWRVRTDNVHGEGRARYMFAWPEDHRVRTSSQYAVEIPFWETIGGFYATDPEDEATYLRLAGGINPAEREVEISAGGAIIRIDNVSYNIIRDLEISNGEIGIEVSGVEARHNLIENCQIRHGRIRILITQRASHTTVSHCELLMAFIGAQPGAWGGQDFESGQREFVYNFFKQVQSPSASSDDRAIRVQNGASDTLIEGNLLDGGLVAVTSSSNRRLTVRNNVIHDFSSVGLSIISGSVDAHFHDNLIYNCNKNIRLHRLNQGDGYRVYLYRNRLFQPQGVGEHIYTHAHTEEQLEQMNIDDYGDPEVTIYHNTFIGGSCFMSLTTRMRNGVPGFRFINNVIASERTFRWFRDDTVIGAFDYNWINDSGSFDQQVWFGEHNILDSGPTPWPTDHLPDFQLPEDSTARHAGIDVSLPFVMEGHLYEPLPGMEPGYFSGDRPNIGAIQ